MSSKSAKIFFLAWTRSTPFSVDDYFQVFSLHLVSNTFTICFHFCLQMLSEVGYQAGQHEVLAESFSKEVYKNLHEQAKQLKEIRRRNIKESDKLVTELNSAFKSMQSSKEKFRKAFEDQEKAQQAFARYDLA